jgi:glycine/D-amino acid oxidase-like deaminating enzyme
VIGAGIVGISIAYHLARRGVKVTVLDKGQPGMGCTQGAFAMLIAGRPEGSAEFNALYGLAVQDWRRLQAEIPIPLPIQWGGTVNWAAPGAPSARLETERRRLVSWGVAAEQIDVAAFRELCPQVMPGMFGTGDFVPGQGAIDIRGAFTILLAQCRRHGVEFRTVAVTGFALDSAGHARIVTASGPIEADRIVLAAGGGTTALAATAGVGVPLDIVSGTLAHTKPMPPILGRVLNGPTGSIKQNPDGRIVVGLDYAPGANGTDISEAYGRMLLATAAKVMPALQQAELDFMTVGHVPIPAKGQQPIVGFCAHPANLYLASMMSGVTMAPLMGRLIASEIVDGMPLDILSSYRPRRFNAQWAFASYGRMIEAYGTVRRA